MSLQRRNVRWWAGALTAAALGLGCACSAPPVTDAEKDRQEMREREKKATGELNRGVEKVEDEAGGDE